MVMRRDGKPIVWPEPKHGDPKSPAVLAGKLAPWRTAAECTDWSIVAPSIFDRKKPLAENTLKRIARGIQRFVIEWCIIDQDYRGEKYAKDKQVARCGNAVPPPFAEALVRANLSEMCHRTSIVA